jgi:hypothetical protein
MSRFGEFEGSEFGDVRLLFFRATDSSHFLDVLSPARYSFPDFRAHPRVPRVDKGAPSRSASLFANATQTVVGVPGTLDVKPFECKR